MEKNNLMFSLMTLNDLEEIKNILNSDFDNFWNYETLKDEINSSFSKYYIIKELDTNTIIAFSGIKIILDEAELMNIVTKKDYRNKHIASFMLENIILECKKYSIKNINLEVNINNTIAIKLYNKYNFIKVGLRKKYYNNIDDAILMKHSIYYT